ncbi:uncharacterized protein B0H64DRAFT_165414 [Chaetomium fimeti]|uniref:Uncharacterized protein n=1 Tax=Chaetomium fimeti TaxID=1854472 RepID=A0AAE0LTG7_9PEZI|nr:hypothetical protein B0H64DRAFT_165414 [Chaetomium fimeti]
MLRRWRLGEKRDLSLQTTVSKNCRCPQIHSHTTRGRPARPMKTFSRGTTTKSIFTPVAVPGFDRIKPWTLTPCTVLFSALAPSMQLKTRRRVVDVVIPAHLLRDAAVDWDWLWLGRRTAPHSVPWAHTQTPPDSLNNHLNELGLGLLRLSCSLALCV